MMHMSRHMERTTVRLPKSLLDRARKKAAAEGRTLTSLIEEGLRAAVEPSQKKLSAETRTFPPISSVGDGLHEGVDLSRSADIQEIMDEQVSRDAKLVKFR